MKKTVLFILAFFFVTLLTKAQGPTLTASTSSLALGETFVNQVAQTSNLPSYSGGAGKTWDYSGLIDSSVAASGLVLMPSETPYAASFPSSNLAAKTDNNSNYVYFNSQPSQLSVVGIYAADTGQITYTTPKIYLPYPFSYNSTFDDSVVGVSEKYNITLRGKDSLTADGYGTLLLPGNKTYNNVLRVQYIENDFYKKDTSITVIGQPVAATFVLNVRTVSYLYFTPGTHVPLVTINETTSSTSIEEGILSLPLSQSTSSSATYFKASSALPLSFTSFTALLQNKNVLLNWKTAQETNTSRFNIQRSLTGVDFATIDAITASGNSAGWAYGYADKAFAKTNVPPTVYYRIQEVDKNGKLFYSGTAVVHGDRNIIALYPNPASNAIHFTIADAAVADAVVIYDAKGRAVKQWSHYQLSQPMTIANLSKGSYFIKVSINGKATTTTFVKQ